MDIMRFDRITMTLAEQPSRRDLLRLLGVTAFGVGALTLLGSDEAEARRRRKKRKNKKNKKPSCKGRCGGKCPRCRAGATCETRDECTTALCVNDVCTSPVNADECGLDTDGETCFARDSLNADRFCSRQICKVFAGGSCADCKGQEQCAPAGGDDIECCAPCGSPL